MNENEIEKYVVYNLKTKQEDYKFFKIHNAEDRAFYLNSAVILEDEIIPKTTNWVVKEIFNKEDK